MAQVEKNIMELVNTIAERYDAEYNYNETNLAVIDFSEDDDSISILKDKMASLIKEKNDIMQEMLDLKSILKANKQKAIAKLAKDIETQKKITKEQYNKICAASYRSRVYVTKGTIRDKKMSEYIKCYPNLLVNNSYYENATEKTYEIYRLSKNSTMSIKEFSIMMDAYLSNRKLLKFLYREIDKARHASITKCEKMQKLNKKLNVIIEKISDLELELEFLQ